MYFQKLKQVIDDAVMLFYRIRNRIRDLRRALRYDCQRFVKGYADVDVWNMDLWFIRTVKPMLKELREHHCGCPGEMTDEEWTATLIEMENHLAQMEEPDYGDKFTMEKFETLNKERGRHKDEFFRLFAEHFWALWD